jgi:hypothetical protein
MAGVQVYAVDNSPSIVSEYAIRLSSGSVAGATQLNAAANSCTSLGIVATEELVVLGAWIKTDVVAAATCNLTLVQSGTFEQLGSGQGGSYDAAARPADGTAVTSAMRVTQTIDLNAGVTANILKALTIHPASSGGTLNNNVIPPGGELYAHIAQASSSSFVGTLIVRVTTKGR